MVSIGAFALVTDVAPKSETALAALRELGYDDSDILTQCRMMDAEGVHYL